MDSREAFLRVDVDYIYAVAKWGKAVSTRRFALASSPSAKESSSSFYLRAKEQVERCVSELDFEYLQIAHPPLILGERFDTRPIEQIAAAFFKLLPARSINLDYLMAQVVCAASVIFGFKSYKNSLIFSLYFV